MNKTKKMTNYITRAAIIAALYAAVTLVVYPLSFGNMQVRISEALTILPFFMPEAVTGLFVGCLISNFFSPNFVILDVIFGSLATLSAAMLTHLCAKMGKKGRWLAPLPPVLINAVVIGLVIALSTTGSEEGAFYTAFIFNCCTVGISQFVSCYGLGIPLSYVFEKIKNKLKVH